MKSKWSNELINTTKKIIGDGCMVKSSDWKFGFFSSTADGGVRIFGVESKDFVPLPSNKIIATFSSVEEMLAAGWVVD